MRKFLLAAAFASISANVMAVSEQEALSNPEDAQLNRTFAQEQFAEGNYQKALEGIERVIIASPLDLSARFFRINLMVILKRGAEVRDELQTILGLALPEADLQRARDLLARIDRSEARFNGRISAKFGLEYDDNVNGWSDLDQTTATTAVQRTEDSLARNEQLSDTASSLSLSFSGSYALTSSKETLLKFSMLGRTKSFSDTINKEQDLSSFSLGLSQKVGSLTGEVGVSQTNVNKVNQALPEGGSTLKELTTDVEIASSFVNLNYRVSPALSVNYRFTDGENQNDGISVATDYDVDTSTHALTALTPIRQGLLMQLGYTQTQTRNQDQSTETSGFDPKELTDADTKSVSLGLFATLPSGDSLSARITKANTENLFASSFVGLINDTDRLTISVDYRTDLDRFISSAEGWSLGVGVKSVDADSNNADNEKTTNSANLFIERKWDIWK